VIDAKTYLFMVTYIAIFANIVISLYGILVRPNIIKKIVALSIFGDCTFIYAILIGFRKIEPYPTIPIMTAQQPSQEYIKEFVSTAVDQLWC
jgi:multicomponent Na+:H+ antiporter subunit C